MAEIITGIAAVVVTLTPLFLPHFIGRLALSPAFFLIFGAPQLALAVGGYRAVELVGSFAYRVPLAYDIWRDLKVRALLKDGEREQGDDRSRKH